MKRLFADDDGFLTGLGMVATSVLVVIVFIGTVLGTYYLINHVQCEQIRTMTGNDVHVTISTGCLVKHNSRWLTPDAFLSGR